MTIRCDVTGVGCEIKRCQEYPCVLHAAGVTKAMAQKPVAEMARAFAASDEMARAFAASDEPRICVECGTLYKYGERHACAQRTDTSALLSEREKTYGDFREVSNIAQAIKDIIHGENNCRVARKRVPLLPRQLEALDCIAMKMARILSGDPDYADNWDDIAGYAKLCSKPPAPLKMDWANPTVDRRVRQRRVSHWYDLASPNNVPARRGMNEERRKGA